MSIKLLTGHHFVFLTLKGGRTGSSESTLVKCHIVGNLMSPLIYSCIRDVVRTIVTKCVNHFKFVFKAEKVIWNYPVLF